MSKPNFLLILADDLGYSDIGCFGSEIKTPYLDQLASEGTRLLNHHTASACSPTRAMTLSGTDNHLAGLGSLLEHKSGKPEYNGYPEYQGFLSKKVAPLPEILQDNGYLTTITGKWHLGMRPEYGPKNRGFDKVFSLLPGCCNHYGYEPQSEGAESRPPLGNTVIHVLDDKKVDVAPNVNDDPKGFYSSNTYTDKLIDYLENRTPDEKEKPFFSYLTYTAPHWPIQSPKHVREKYYDTYKDGPEALRLQRLKNMVELGIISEDVIPHEVVKPSGVTEWDEMDDYQRACSQRCMAAYAGMVEEIDRNIGRVIDYLKETGEYDNTFIFFMSDNGAEGAALEAIPVFGSTFMKNVQKYYNNELENIGNYDSFTWIGPYWAQASTAPSRLYKLFPSEGGIRVPALVKAPKSTNPFRDDITAGKFVRSFTTCMDIAPTILDLAGVPLEFDSLGQRLHRNAVVEPFRGKSWIPHFEPGSTSDLNKSSAIYTEDMTVGWELFARAALRKGDWKIVHLDSRFGGKGNGFNDDGWELFNVEDDPGETTDLAAEKPEKLKELLLAWDDYVREVHVVWGDKRAEPISEEEDPTLWDKAMEQQRAWMQTPQGSAPVFAK